MGANNSKSHIARRGLDIPITGEPEQKIYEGRPVSTVAISADDYVGMKPRMQIVVGDQVKRGQVLFEDRKTSGILYTSPGAGTVKAINRGKRRVLQSVVVELDESEKGSTPSEVSYESFIGKEPAELSSDEIRAALIECGLWTSLRTRPFSKVPTVDSSPRSIFVTAMDTNPLSANAAAAINGREAEFEAGLKVLCNLLDRGKVYLCKRAGSKISAGNVTGVETHEFKGKHPTGTAGYHIHVIDPADRNRVVWYVGYQDVAAIGHFFKAGKLSMERVISLAGPRVTRPRLIRTRLGAPIDTLLSGETKPGDNRVLSGSILNGRTVKGEATGYLGRYHNQITVLSEGNKKRFLGWLAPGFNQFSMLRIFGSNLLPGKKFDFDTDLKGGVRGLVPVGLYDKVMPFDLMPTFLLRSVLAGNMETAEELGVLELDEEDIALCTFVCPSKIEYGPALREMLTLIEKEG